MSVARDSWASADKVRHAQEAKTWKDLAQAAFKKQLAPKERPAEVTGLSTPTLCEQPKE